jgi:hypothetical protein
MTIKLKNKKAVKKFEEDLRESLQRILLDPGYETA